MSRKGRYIIASTLFVLFFLVKIAVSGLLLQGISLTLTPEETALAEEGSTDSNTNNMDAVGLYKKEQELRKWEEDLKKREAQILPLQKEIDRRMAELEEIQANLTVFAKKLAEREKTLNDTKVQHLVSLYKAMEPTRAAVIMSKLEVPIAVRILGNMSGKAAGQILEAMSPELGATISKQLSKTE